MSKKRESVDKLITAIPGEWKFDEQVAKSFDTHVRKSIPLYDEVQKMVVEISEWFVRDERRQNGKILKDQSLILKDQSIILSKIEEGQRKGFTALEQSQRKGFETLAQILERVEESQNRGFATLAGIQKESNEILTRILAK